MRDQNGLPDVLTVDEIARYLRVSRTTVCRWCVQGRLPAFRIGRGWRVQRGDLEQYIKHAMAGGELEQDDPLARISDDWTQDGEEDTT